MTLIFASLLIKINSSKNQFEFRPLKENEVSELTFYNDLLKEENFREIKLKIDKMEIKKRLRAGKPAIKIVVRRWEWEITHFVSRQSIFAMENPSLRRIRWEKISNWFDLEIFGNSCVVIQWRQRCKRGTYSSMSVSLSLDISAKYYVVI